MTKGMLKLKKALPLQQNKKNTFKHIKALNNGKFKISGC